MELDIDCLGACVKRKGQSIYDFFFFCSEGGRLKLKENSDCLHIEYEVVV